MWPWENGANGIRSVKTRALWVFIHTTCAAELNDGRPLIPPICPHWKKLGHCVREEKCFYSHPPRQPPPNAETATGLSSINQKFPSSALSLDNRKVQNPGRIQNRGAGRRNKVQNSQRAAFFRQFLINTYGLDILCEGTGVLDVAGGKGELAFQLTNLSCIPTTVIDPRPLCVKPYVRKYHKGLYHSSHETPPPPIAPPHIRMFFRALFAAQLPSVSGPPIATRSAGLEPSDEPSTSPSVTPPPPAAPHPDEGDVFEKELDAAKRVAWTRKGLTATEVRFSLPPDHIPAPQ
ncbi:hypothetical protein CYMTET_39665, partial [Cymbomonas tetramitiformis]